MIWKDVSGIFAEEWMKNLLPHRVPLTDMMITELKALRLTHNQELLFPHRLNNREPMRSESIWL